jgi:predicted Fe-Mo cluster-binding NifX family protein
VTIAIPVWQERVSPVLDTAARLLLVEHHRGSEANRREITLAPSSAEALARGIADLHVDVLLCAALSEPLWRALEARGVRVRPHLCGDAEEVLRAFYCGRLKQPEFRMPGCWGEHSGAAICHRPTAGLGTPKRSGIARKVSA